MNEALTDEDRANLAECREVFRGHLAAWGTVLGIFLLTALLGGGFASEIKDLQGHLVSRWMPLTAAAVFAPLIYWGWKASAEKHLVVFSLSLRGITDFIIFRGLTSCIYGMGAAPYAFVELIKDLRTIHSFKKSLGLSFFQRHPNE